MPLPKNCETFTAVAGFVFLSLGAICGWHIFPKIVAVSLRKEMALDGKNLISEAFVETQFPIVLHVYIFHVLNPEQVQNGFETPKVREMGPYVYHLYRKKLNVTFDEETDTVTYLAQKRYYFNSNASGCRSDEEVLTILNPILTSTALQISHLAESFLTVIEDAVPYMFPNSTDVFLRAKVKDILFDGIRIYCGHSSVRMYGSRSFITYSLIQILEEFICGAIEGLGSPTLRPAGNDKDYLFSMMYHLNTTIEGPFVVAAGLNSPRGTIYEFKGRTDLRDWAGRCNMVNGTDASTYPQILGVPDRLYVFNQDLCRSLYVSFEKTIETRGLSLLRFVAGRELFENDEDNLCFCVENLRKNCPPSGTTDLSPCYQGPVLLSFPHFLHAQEELKSFIPDLKPDKDKHETFIELEPMTGIPLRAVSRFQWNVELVRLEKFNLLNNVSEGVMPICWIEQNMALPEFFIENIQTMYFRIFLVHLTQWALIVTGVLLLMVTLILVVYRENMWCFTKTARISAAMNIRSAEVASNISLGEENLNPKLYPQIMSRNTNIELTHRVFYKGSQWVPVFQSYVQ